MPPAYVKAYDKRNKNDAADAGAICEAVMRPSMRFVPVKEVAFALANRTARIVWAVMKRGAAYRATGMTGMQTA
jgi:transposase